MKRLDALDAARFLAFCGMVLVNFRIAAGVAPGSDWASILIDSLEGRAAALFVVLAGIGIGLSRISAGLLLRRAAFLFVIGLINMTVFDADILHLYALYFVVGAAVLPSSQPGLWLGALGIVVLAVLANLAFDYGQGWDWNTLTYTDLWALPGFLRNALFNGWHPVLPWAAFLLIGMAIGRSELDTLCIQHRLIMWGFGAAVLALFPQMVVSDPDLIAYLGTDSIPPGPFYILAGAGTACVAIGVLLKLWPRIERRRIAPFLTAPGRQSLTLYMAHILIGMGVLEELGLLDGSLTAPQIALYAALFCALSSLFAFLWFRKFRRGPLEALMRRVTESAKG
ncbi:transport protein [Rhodobacteraceae bacterium KLH11]|nr:transport protein [Rhodobacteraceae bacterium KLH11]